MKIDLLLNSDLEELSNVFYAIKKLNISEHPNYKFLKNILAFCENKIIDNKLRDFNKFSWEKIFLI